jgi:competence protein ComEC
MATFLDRFHSLVDEVWEPGYYHTTNSYAEMMRAIEDYDVRHTQPTSGLCRFIGNLQITVLAPGIGLRGRFDSYGVGINNASIALKLDFPASRVIQRRQDRTYVKLPSSKSLILGADAQTLSWSQALVDFPQLGPQRTAVSQALRAARGTVPLRADVFKVPHHGSKHGVNLELVEAISPTLCLISSVAGGGEYNFPHSVAQEAIREGLEALAGKASGKRSPDHELGLHYTCEQSETGKALGTIGVVLTPGGKRRVWRFMDRASDRIDLARSRELI